MADSIGDIIEYTVSKTGVTLKVRFEVDAVGFDQGDPDGPDPDGPFITDGTPVEFAILDRRTPEQVADWQHAYNSQQLDLAAQYVSADPDNPTWHTITNPMRRLFKFSDGVGLGAKRR